MSENKTTTGCRGFVIYRRAYIMRILRLTRTSLTRPGDDTQQHKCCPQNALYYQYQRRERYIVRQNINFVKQSILSLITSILCRFYLVNLLNRIIIV